MEAMGSGSSEKSVRRQVPQLIYSWSSPSQLLSKTTHSFKPKIWESILTFFLCSAGKESVCNAGGLGLIPGLRRCSGEGKGCPLQYSGLENSKNCIVHGVTKSRTWWSDFHFHVHSMDMNLSKLWEIVKDRGDCQAAVHGAAKSQTRLGNRIITKRRLPRWLNSKESACQCRRLGFNSASGRSPGEGKATYSSILA